MRQRPYTFYPAYAYLPSPLAPVRPKLSAAPTAVITSSRQRENVGGTRGATPTFIFVMKGALVFAIDEARRVQLHALPLSYAEYTSVYLHMTMPHMGRRAR